MSYWQQWRAAHPEYRARETERSRRRKAAMTPEQRRRNRGRKRPRPVAEPLAPLMPHLLHGGALSFWEDELRLDLAQEAALARAAGADPDAAVRAYRAREQRWHAITRPLAEYAA